MKTRIYAAPAVKGLRVIFLLTITGVAVIFTPLQVIVPHRARRTWSVGDQVAIGAGMVSRAGVT